MKMINTRMRLALASLLIGAFAVLGVSMSVAPTSAQVPAAPPPPYNSDLGALITNTARAAGTVNSASQTNTSWSGVMCVFNQTAITSTPSTTISIQQLDAASGQWVTLATSTAVTTALNTPQSVVVFPFGQATFSSAAMTGVGIPVGRVWRVQQVMSGGTTTGTVGCNVYRP